MVTLYIHITNNTKIPKFPSLAFWTKWGNQNLELAKYMFLCFSSRFLTLPLYFAQVFQIVYRKTSGRNGKKNMFDGLNLSFMCVVVVFGLKHRNVCN